MAWREMGEDALAAARRLKEARHFRSAITRAYFAAFSVVTAELVQTVGVGQFGKWEHPRHFEVPRHIQRHLEGRIADHDLRWLVHVVRRLYKARLASDYVAKASIGESAAREALRDAHVVFRLLEV